MAKRRSILRIASPDVQGEDSYVDFKKFTWGERKALQRRFQKINEGGADSDKVTAEVQALLVERFAGWNWVTDEDQPMDFPQDNEGFENLLDDELGFLLEKMLDIVTGRDIEDTGKN